MERAIRLRRRWRRLLASSLALLVVAASMAVLGGPGADAAENETAAEDDTAAASPAEGLGGYTSEASGAPVSLLVFEPVTPVPVDPGQPHLRADFNYVLTKLTTGPQGRALASVLWPGALVGDGFPAIAGLLTGESAPEYPLKTDARSPGQEPEVCREPAPGAGMCSYAEGFEVHAVAQGGESPAPDSLVVGAFDAESHGRVVAGQALTTVRVTANDVGLLGGLITIDSVETTITTASDGTEAATSGETKVHGVEILGQAVAVDENGLRQGDEESLTGPLPVLPGGEELADMLGIEARLLETTQAVDGARASRTHGGLQIVVDLGVLREQLDTGPLEELLKQLPPLEDPGLPEELTDQLPIEIFQEPYLTLLPAFMLAPELVFVIGGASSETVATEPLVLDFDLPPPTTTPTTPPPAPPPPATTHSPPATPSGDSGGGPGTSAPIGLGSGPTDSGGSADRSAPDPVVAEPQPDPPLAVEPVSSGPIDAGFGGIAPLLGLLGLLGAAAGSWGMRATTAAVFGVGGCELGAKEHLPDLKGA